MHQIKDYLLRNKFVFIFFVLIAYFVLSAFLETRLTHYMFGLFFAFVMLVSLLVVSQTRTTLMSAAVILSLSIIGVLITGSTELDKSLLIFQQSLSATFLILITGASAHTTFTYDRVDAQTIFGALCTYLFMGLAWSEIYLLMYTIDPAVFKMAKVLIADHNYQQTFSYYSFVTLSTLGYGDITPVAPPARTLAWLEAIMGQAYLTILIAQIVGQYIAQKKDRT